jgi:hypothetical protein
VERSGDQLFDHALLRPVHSHHHPDPTAG